jgi:UDPglucose 6-dehydrogenase
MQQKNIKDLKIGICGVGMVGGAVKNYLEKKEIKPFLYDKGKNLGSIEELNQADVIFICVPTPYDKEKGFDLSYVREACEYIKGSKILVIKSTVWPGTTDKLQQEYPDHKFLFNPEFLTELTAEQDMSYPDRQIIGYTEKSFNVAGDVMQILPLAPFESIIPASEAEMVKYFGNTWFSIKVIFANQMYDLCQKLGLNYDRIRDSVAPDKRIGRSHLEVIHKGYRGYGGKCLCKDIRALIQFADENGVNLELHKKAEELNNRLMKEQNIEDPEKFSQR